jgi:hypothetical protein
MDESDLVVVCHCETHPQLYTIKNDRIDKKLDNSKVSFVDPDVCPEKTWGNIKENTKKYVWAFNCPIGPTITSESFSKEYSGIFLEILEHSKKILIEGGQFITGIGNNFVKRVSLDKFNGVPELSGWKYKIVEANQFTFNLGKYEPGKPTDFKRELVVFTKTTDGGKRKRSTRKGKYRRVPKRKTRR